MVNLHEIASSAINAVNPFQSITITSREDYTVNDYGEAVPTEKGSVTVMAQVQPIDSDDIQFINNYNQSSEYKSFWISSDVFGLNRPLLKGGDKITWNGNEYFVTDVPEEWYETAGWVHVIGCLQLKKDSDDGSGDESGENEEGSEEENGNG